MFENLMNFFKKGKKNKVLNSSSKDTAKERLHLVLMQDRANVSADFLDLMRKEIIEVIKKYIDIDEKSMDVRLTTETNDDGTQGAPALYANIPIINIKDETRKINKNNYTKIDLNKETKEVEHDEKEKNEEADNEKKEDIENKKNSKDDTKEKKDSTIEKKKKTKEETEENKDANESQNLKSEKEKKDEK